MDTKRLYGLQKFILNLAMTMMMTAAIVYRIDLAKLEAYQLILLGTALEIAVILFEIPTGVVADKYSRKLSVIIGYFIVGVGFIVELLTLDFLWIFVAQIIWGFGYTFISGALTAWVSDETENDQIEETLIKANQLAKIGTILGIVGAFGFGIISVRIPMMIAALMYILLGILMIFMMKEHKFEKLKAHHMIKQFKMGFNFIIKHPILKIFMVTVFIYGLYSEGIDRLEEFIVIDKLKDTFIGSLDSIYIVSVMHIVMALLGFLMLSYIKRKKPEGIKTYQWFLAMILMMSAGLFIFGLVEIGYISMLGFFFFRMNEESIYPLYNSIEARQVPSNIKATVMSTFSQIDGMGQILSGLLMTFLSFHFGTKVVLLTTAGLLIIVAYTVWLMILKHKDLEIT